MHCALVILRALRYFASAKHYIMRHCKLPSLPLWCSGYNFFLTCRGEQEHSDMMLVWYLYTLNRVHAVMENVEKSWNLNNWFPDLEVMEIFKNIIGVGKVMQNGSILTKITFCPSPKKVIFWCTPVRNVVCARLGTKRGHTTKWLSYTVLYKMASKTSKISRL